MCVCIVYVCVCVYIYIHTHARACKPFFEPTQAPPASAAWTAGRRGTSASERAPLAQPRPSPALQSGRCSVVRVPSARHIQCSTRCVCSCAWGPERGTLLGGEREERRQRKEEEKERKEGEKERRERERRTLCVCVFVCACVCVDENERCRLGFDKPDR